jgi:tetratricopeptide (TPR) repeat protein
VQIGRTLECTSDMIDAMPLGQAMGQAVSHHQAGRLAEAERLYRAVLAVEPAHPDANHNLGIIALQTGRATESFPYFKAALDAAPEQDQFWLSAVEALLVTERLDEAEVGLQQRRAWRRSGPEFEELSARVTAARHARDQLPRAVKLHETGKLDDAIKAYRRLLALHPAFVAAHLNLSWALQAKGSLEEAETAFRSTLALRPDHGHAWHGLGQVLKQAGRLSEAAQAVRRSTELLPDRVEGHVELGHLLASLGRLDEAIQSAERALEIAPDSIGIRLLHATVSFCRCQWNKASHSFSKVVALTSGQADSSCRIEELERTAALIPIGRSGSLFLHSLFDGHPDVSTIPGAYLRGWFEPRIWAQLQPDFARRSWRRDFSRRLVETFRPVFDAESRNNVPGQPFGDAKWLARSCGFTTMGPDRNVSFKADHRAFEEALRERLSPLDRISAKDAFKLFHLAFDDAAGRPAGDRLLFHHIHVANVIDLGGYLRRFPQAKVLYLARNPVQALESWMLALLGDQHEISLKQWESSVRRIEEVLHGFQPALAGMAEMRCVRLEDIKRDPHRAMPQLAAWLGLSDDPALYRSEFHGIQYWGPSSRETQPITGFSTASIEQRIGKIFGVRDILIFETLFWPFTSRFGYSDWDEAEFKARLREIGPWLDEPLQFERLFHVRLPQPRPELDSLPVVSWLHAVLKSCWTALDRRADYPALIQPVPMCMS